MVVRYSLIAILVTLSFACKDEGTPPPENVTGIQLSFEDASCTEVWLKATTAAIPATIALLRDNHRVQILRLSISDSLLIDEGLLPNHAYSYQLQKLGTDSSVIETTETLQMTTMDTTSHDFMWQMDTLGVTASTLSDVAIISDNDVWAVGELYLNDSSGQLDRIRYNAAHWDGNSWMVLRVPYYYQGQPLYNPIQTVFAFGQGDIWFAGNGVIHLNNQQYIPVTLPPAVWGADRINKIWGVSSDDLYIVGDEGSVAHYFSGTWSRVESGVTANIQDVWGYTNQSGATTILAVASPSPETEILSITNRGVRDTMSWFPNYPLSSTWMSSTPAVYVASQGIWRNRGSGWHGMVGPSNTFYTGIRGSCENNVAAVGWGGVLSHFNGISWRTYTQIPPDFFFEAVAVSQDMIVAVGYTVNGVSADKAAVAIGKRVQ